MRVLKVVEGRCSCHQQQHSVAVGSEQSNLCLGFKNPLCRYLQVEIGRQRLSDELFQYRVGEDTLPALVADRSPGRGIVRYLWSHCRAIGLRHIEYRTPIVGPHLAADDHKARPTKRATVPATRSADSRL